MSGEIREFLFIKDLQHPLNFVFLNGNKFEWYSNLHDVITL